MTSPYRLLLMDLDGTLVGDTDHVSPRTVAAIHAARETGCIPVICTGRNRYVTEHILSQIGECEYAILVNGAVIYSAAERRTLHKITLDAGTVRSAVALAHRHEVAPLCFGVDSADGKLVYTDGRLPVQNLFAEDNAERLRTYTDLTDLPALPLSMGVYGPRERVEPLAEAWREALGDRACVYDQPQQRYRCWTSYFQSGRASKAAGAQILAEMLGIRREETIALGDHMNDRDLLQWAGLGVCMGDGHEAARACADHITGCLAEDGAAQAIERFVLSSYKT